MIIKCNFCIGECVLSCFSRVQLFATPWIVAHQAPLSMGILQARILELPCLPPDPGIELPPDPGILPTQGLNPDSERVTGRKARGLQMEEMVCKCQTFLFLS